MDDNNDLEEWGRYNYPPTPEPVETNWDREWDPFMGWRWADGYTPGQAPRENHQWEWRGMAPDGNRGPTSDYGWQEVLDPRFIAQHQAPPQNTPQATPPYYPPSAPTFNPGFSASAPSSSFSWPSYSMPAFDPGPAFSYKDFVRPDAQSVMDDPGFQFRIDQGRKALEASAAGKGILRSGGTLKDLLSYGQNFASQEYGRVYDRALQEYDTNRQNAWDSYMSGYTGRRDKYSFDQNNAQFGFNAQQRQTEFDAREAFDRWAKQGDWYSEWT